MVCIEGIGELIPDAAGSSRYSQEVHILMTNRKKVTIAIGVLLAVALVVGLTTLAVTNYGTQSDPLVTLSYLQDTLTPQIMEQLEDQLYAKADELTEDFENLLSQNGGSSTSAGTATFSVVTLNAGDVLSCSVGTEIMPRIGTVVSAGSDSPRLIDETTGESISSSDVQLEHNHMYMVTIDGNGIKATSSSKVLIRGSYTVN